MKYLTIRSLRLSAWLQVCVGAAAALIWIVPVTPIGIAPMHRPDLPKIVLVPTVLIPDMNQLIARPLFAQTRRPQPPVPVQPRPAPPQLQAATTAGMVLLGVLNTGTKTWALVTLPGQSRSQLVTVSDLLGDWKVMRIDPAEILLQAGSETSELALPAPAAAPAQQNGIIEPSQGFPMLPGRSAP